MSATMIVGRVLLPALGLILAVALGWQAASSTLPRFVRDAIGTTPRTDPAAPLSSRRVIAEGRVAAYPGCEVTVGSEVLGTIVRMPARVKQAVRKGDLLVELRADAAQASVREAHSSLVEAESDLLYEQGRFRLDRVVPGLAGRDLRPLGSRRDMASAVARRDTARAAVERAEAEAARFRILAPIDGVVIAVHADPGETANPAAPLVTVADLSRLRVEAELDEFDIGRVGAGAKATLTAAGGRGRSWQGVVEEIADAVRPRSTLPEDPARSADSRVLAVNVSLPESTGLILGQRVEVAIDTGDAAPVH